jgi:hypothetical protein
MSSGLKRKILEGFCEIFHNSQTHSESRHVFTCGQYYAKKNVFIFNITDSGIGIKENIKEHNKIEMPADEAILWATKEINTTKKDSHPGGLGLKLLIEFIKLNRGSIIIVSDRGYYELKNGSNNPVLKTFEYPFPGTSVSIKIITSDDRSYSLSTENDEMNL